MNAGDDEHGKTKPGDEPMAGSESTAEAETTDLVAVGLYPALSRDERRQAMANLRRYFEIACAMAEEQAREKAGLTQPKSVPTMKERSNVHFNL
jgi:hypothetical protein